MSSKAKKIKIYEVTFGSFTRICVVSTDCRAAMLKAMSSRQKDYQVFGNDITDITKVELIAEED